MIKARVPGDVALRDVVKGSCDALEPSTDLTHVDLVALGAGALTSGRRDQTRRMVKVAEQALLDAFAAPEALSPADRAHLDLELSTTHWYVSYRLCTTWTSARKAPGCGSARAAPGHARR
ncbi:hypothetical protein ACWGH7_05205 [Streptomyces cyaneofuscatus]